MDDTIMDIILHPLTSLLLGIVIIVMGVLTKNGVIDIEKNYPLRNIIDMDGYLKVLFFHAYTIGCLYIILSFTAYYIKNDAVNAFIVVIIIVDYIVYRIRLRKYYT
ncbi:hypothetical protein [Caloranaerobacter ferrireducens]|uniref:hypothetical protein n=1 Tax=Caloranaerobacter ferrireducens TaxID=1323370 RepID=UPI00084D91FC|nr:hypothetical protein [Caloranaerobacter ferrireducens]